jgi:hypothetical protein
MARPLSKVELHRGHFGKSCKLPNAAFQTGSNRINKQKKHAIPS